VCALRLTIFSVCWLFWDLTFFSGKPGKVWEFRDGLEESENLGDCVVGKYFFIFPAVGS